MAAILGGLICVGFILVLLSPLAFIFCKECPYCTKTVSKRATVCPYCQQWLDRPPPQRPKQGWRP